MTLPFERAAWPAGTSARLPRLSVVLISTGDRAHLERCLAATMAEYGSRAHEILVVRAGPATETVALERIFGGIRFVALPECTSDQLRAAGIREAEGEVIALVRDADVPQRLHPPRCPAP